MIYFNIIKIKKQWTRADSIIKIVGISLGGVTGIVTVVITPLIALAIIGIVTGSFTAFDLFLTEALKNIFR